MDYDFQVVDHDGALLEGEVEADSEERARWLLRQEYPQLQRVVRLKAIKPEVPTKFSVPSSEMVVFYRRLAVMLESGVNIDKALLFLSQSSEGPLAVMLEALQSDVASGKNLDATLRKPLFAKVFPPLAVGLIGTGLQTGTLAESLSKLADITEKRQKQKQAFVSALTYPTLLALCIFLVALVFVFFVAPGEGGIFAVLGGDLPWPSQVLMTASEALRSPLLWWLVGLGLLAGVPALRHFLLTETAFRRRLDRYLLEVPLLGSLLVKVTASQVLYIWSSAIRVGVPLSGAIALSRQVISNVVLRERLETATGAFAEGSDFGEALAVCQVFPPMVSSMVSLSLEAGQLDVMMERVSELYDEEVDIALAQFSAVLEPLLLLGAGLLAGFVALACLMPMLQLTARL